MSLSPNQRCLVVFLSILLIGGGTVGCVIAANGGIRSGTATHTDVQCPGDGTCSNQGTCDYSTGTCVCHSGFQGNTCQDVQCPGNGTCSNQGTCDYSTGTCVCHSGFQGNMCQG